MQLFTKMLEGGVDTVVPSHASLAAYYTSIAFAYDKTFCAQLVECPAQR